MKILSYIMVDTRVFFLHLANHQSFHHPKNSRIYRSMFLEFTFSTISLLQRLDKKLETGEIRFNSANLNEQGTPPPRDGHWKNSFISISISIFIYIYLFTGYLAFFLFLLPFSMVLLPFFFWPPFFLAAILRKLH